MAQLGLLNIFDRDDRIPNREHTPILATTPSPIKPPCPTPHRPPSPRPRPLEQSTPVRSSDMYRSQRARLSNAIWSRSASSEQYQRDETDYSDESEREYDEKAYSELHEPERLSFKVRAVFHPGLVTSGSQLTKIGQTVWIRLQETWYRGQVRRILETEQSKVRIGQDGRFAQHSAMDSWRLHRLPFPSERIRITEKLTASVTGSQPAIRRAFPPLEQRDQHESMFRPTEWQHQARHAAYPLASSTSWRAGGIGTR